MGEQAARGPGGQRGDGADTLWNGGGEGVEPPARIIFRLLMPRQKLRLSGGEVSRTSVAGFRFSIVLQSNLQLPLAGAYQILQPTQTTPASPLRSWLVP